jgi:hypothetical protein
MNYLDENYQVTLVTCDKCGGTGEVECCNGHMCPGTTKCHVCDGKGKRLSDGDRKLKKALEKLMEYR